MLKKESIGLDFEMRGECEESFVDLIKKLEKKDGYEIADHHELRNAQACPH